MSPLSRPDALTPGERILVALCRRRTLDPPVSRSELAPLDTPDVAGHLATLATRHSVLGLVLTRLRSVLGPEASDHPNVGPLLRQLPILTKKATLWAFEERRVLAALTRGAPRFLVLKGGALRHYAYDDPVERPMGDLDLLCDPSDVDRLVAALRLLGYRSRYPDEARRAFRRHLYHERVTHENGFEVEVHWGLTRPGTRFPLDAHAFRRRAVKLEPMPQLEVEIPSPEDMILHLVSQSQQGGVRTLKRIVDLDRAVAAAEEIDWEYLREAAAEAALTSHLAVTLRLANLLLDTPAPPPILGGHDVPPDARRWLEVMRPAHRVLRWPRRGRHMADLLFEIWCLPDLATARGALLDVARTADEDPLTWIWIEYEGQDVQRRWFLTGAERTLKLGGIQLAMAGRRVVGALGTGASRPGSFWLASPPR